MIKRSRFNIFNNSCGKIIMANVAQMCNNLHCLLLIGEGGCITTPTYHVFDMFKDHQGGKAIRAFAEDNGDIKHCVSVSASHKDGIMTVTLANTSIDGEAVVSLDPLGLSLPDTAEIIVLASDNVRSVNTFDEPSRVSLVCYSADPRKPLTIPKGGIMALKFAIEG